MYKVTVSYTEEVSIAYNIEAKDEVTARAKAIDIFEGREEGIPASAKTTKIFPATITEVTYHKENN